MNRIGIIYPEVYFDNPNHLFFSTLLFDKVLIPDISLEYDCLTKSIGFFQKNRLEIDEIYHDRTIKYLKNYGKYAQVFNLFIKEDIISVYPKHPISGFEFILEEGIKLLYVLDPSLSSKVLNASEKMNNYIKYFFLKNSTRNIPPPKEFLRMLKKHGIFDFDSYLKYLSYLLNIFEPLGEAIEHQYYPITCNTVHNDLFHYFIPDETKISQNNLRKLNKNSYVLANDILERKFLMYDLSIDDYEFILRLREKLKSYVDNFWIGITKLTASLDFPDDLLSQKDLFDNIISKEIEPILFELENIIKHPGKNILKGILNKSQSILSGAVTFTASYQATQSLPVSALSSMIGIFLSSTITEILTIDEIKKKNYLTYVIEFNKESKRYFKN